LTTCLFEAFGFDPVLPPRGLSGLKPSPQRIKENVHEEREGEKNDEINKSQKERGLKICDTQSLFLPRNV
jgi:hypothetical protein